MPMKPKVPKKSMSPQERRVRSRANLILASDGILHGTLSVRHQVCGKPNCRCTRGDKHRTLVLTVRVQGSTQQIQIPARLEETVQQWLDKDQEIRELLLEISGFHQDRVIDMKKKRGT